MRIVIQRVKSASVEIDTQVFSKINQGILVFLGIAKSDTENNIDFFINKLLNLRMFEDDSNKMNKSIQEINGEILVVSQFTLYGNCQKGRRPSFDQAAKPEVAIPLYNKFIEKLKTQYPKKIQTGKFGADMQVKLENDGPVTFII
jgi:D-aminoacyl-tRNA deacylase